MFYVTYFYFDLWAPGRAEVILTLWIILSIFTCVDILLTVVIAANLKKELGLPPHWQQDTQGLATRIQSYTNPPERTPQPNQQLAFPEFDHDERGEYDEAMSSYLEMWKRNPIQLGWLRRLRDISYRRHRERWGPVREKNLFRFGIVCVLSILSSKFSDWDMGEVDWWPFAVEDEIMMVRPYMAKRRWRSVLYPFSILNTANSNSAELVLAASNGCPFRNAATTYRAQPPQKTYLKQIPLKILCSPATRRHRLSHR